MPSAKLPEFKQLFESAPGLYLVLRPNFEICAVSDSYLKATLVKREQILGKNLFEVFPDNPNDPTATGVSQLTASLKRVLENKTADTMAIQKYDIRRPDGRFEERYWSPFNCPVLDEDHKVKFIIHRVEDVTELMILKKERIDQSTLAAELKSEKDNSEKIRQAQRMEAMGQLAGGVAHDFNNLLATILLTCESGLEDPTITDNEKVRLREILSCSQRGASLTRQLLAFCRKQILQPKVLCLNTTIESLKFLLRRLLREDIQLETRLFKDLSATYMDPGQIEQVILNLVINAQDAMPKGGHVTISTSNVRLDRSMASGNMNVEPGNYILLSVQDTGIGMDSQTQARIFEPFFTTKDIGKGTGLGLSTVYGIVKQNNGTIWVYSEPGKGTVFKIYFPAMKEKAKTSEILEEATSKIDLNANRSYTILLAEDEDQLREAVADALKRKGYVVYETENGARALSFLRENRNLIDLVITDVVMPEMDGPTLAQKMSEMGIDTTVLFLSGYIESDVAIPPHLHSFFLEKPFSLSALTRKVSEILR